MGRDYAPQGRMAKSKKDPKNIVSAGSHVSMRYFCFSSCQMAR
jgi:hypothetical protein